MNEVKYEYTTWKGEMPQSHLQTLARRDSRRMR